jgi:hypothetical protein
MTRRADNPKAASQEPFDEGLETPLVAEIAALSAPARFVSKIEGVVIGTVVKVDSDGGARVDFIGNPAGQPVAVRSTVGLDSSSVGREAALSFEGGDPRLPIVLGLIVSSPGIARRPPPLVAVDSASEVAHERMVIELDRDVEVRVGRASVTLTRDGAIELRGEYILSRAEGTQRILGGTVRIN